MFLVTGATGDVGRRLIDALAVAGADVRAVTRDPGDANLPSTVDTVAGDPSRPDTIASALRGITGLFVNPRAVRKAIDELLALAAEHGVRRVVALSAINVDEELATQPSRYIGDRNREVEDAVTRCGLDWVCLRPSYFAVNVLRSWAGQIRAGDVVRGPYPGFAEAPIDLRDLAEIGARALLTDELVGRRPVLTGPESLSHRDMVATIGAALGRSLRYQEIPPETARRAMIERGLPGPYVDALMARYARGNGRPATTTDEVARILGRARTFAEWATDHAAAFS